MPRKKNIVSSVISLIINYSHRVSNCDVHQYTSFSSLWRCLQTNSRPNAFVQLWLMEMVSSKFFTWWYQPLHAQKQITNTITIAHSPEPTPKGPCQKTRFKMKLASIITQSQAKPTSGQIEFHQHSGQHESACKLGQHLGILFCLEPLNW